jgi:hypothetical protein
MLVGSAPSELKLGSTTVTGVRRGAGLIYDSDVAAFQKASGAAQVGPILALVDYLKAESLWDYARFYPMKSAQNAGSGSTVYGLGGLTSNNMTLVNSPTWGSDGVTFNAASSQYGTISDFLGGGTVNLFWTGTNTSATGGLDLPCFGQYDYGASQRSVAIAKGSTGTLRVARSEDGTAAEIYQSGAFPPVSSTVSAEWVSGGGRAAFINKDAQSLSLIVGSAQTERLNTSVNVTVMAYLNNGTGEYFSSGTVIIAGVIETALTTAQREAITDLINAL